MMHRVKKNLQSNQTWDHITLSKLNHMRERTLKKDNGAELKDFRVKKGDQDLALENIYKYKIGLKRKM